MLFDNRLLVIHILGGPELDLHVEYLLVLSHHLVDIARRVEDGVALHPIEISDLAELLGLFLLQNWLNASTSFNSLRCFMM
jgi:hypothetical protein